jgi:DNA-binding IclR family transcriptional regulator
MLYNPLSTGFTPMPRKAKVQSVADEQSTQGVAAVNRALSIMAAFDKESPILTLNELAERTRLYKSTILRLLESLIQGNLIKRFDDGRYGLNHELARLYSVYIAAFSMEQVVMPVLRALVDATGESAAYHIRQSEMRLCLYRIDSPQPIRDHIKAGDLLPLRRGAGGRVLTAFDTAFPETEDVARDPLFAAVRKQGYFAGDGDRGEGVAGISAPVFRANRELAGAVTLTMPTERYDEAFIKPVVAAANKLSGLT